MNRPAMSVQSMIEQIQTVPPHEPGVFVLDVMAFGSNRDAKQMVDELNQTRKNGEVFGSQMLKDGRWQVIRTQL